MPRFKLNDNSKQAALILTINGHELHFLKDAKCATEVDESTANIIRENPELVEVFDDPLKTALAPKPEQAKQEDPKPVKKGKAKRRG